MEMTSFDLETNEPLPASAGEETRVTGWEMVEKGRYRPRRTRGSFPGRELG